MFRVNFDPALAAALKEAVLLESKSEEDEAFALPQQVLALNKSRDVLRRHVLRLSHICDTINTVNHTLRACEHPLVKDEAAQMSAFLMRAVNELQWAQPEEVEAYVTEGLQQVGRLERAMVVLREASDSSQNLLTDFAAEDKFLPLVPTRSDARVLTEPEFRKRVAEHAAARRERLKAIGEAIHARLGDTFAALNEIKASAGVRALERSDSRWLVYLEDYSASVAEALSRCAAKSLKGLVAQLDPEQIQQNNGIPLLDVKLALSRPPNNKDLHAAPTTTAIVFDPPLLSFERLVAKAVSDEKEANAATRGGGGGAFGAQKSGGAAAAASDAALHAKHQQRLTDMYPPNRAPATSVEGALDTYVAHIIDVNDEVKCVDPAYEADTYRRRVDQDEEVNALLRAVRASVDATVARAADEVAAFAEHSFLFSDNIAAGFNAFVEAKAAEEAARPHDSAKGPRVVPY